MEIYLTPSDIPDPRLARYRGTMTQTVEDLVSSFDDLLVPLHSLALSVVGSIRLGYLSKGKEPLQAILGMEGDSDRAKLFQDILNSSELGHAYRLAINSSAIQHELPECFSGSPLKNGLSSCCRLVRGEQRVPHEHGPSISNLVLRWVPAKSRLFRTLQLMESLPRSVAISMTFFPVNQEKLETVLESCRKEIQKVRQRLTSPGNSLQGFWGTRSSLSRDFERLVEEMATKSSFFADISVYAETFDDAHLVASRLASEAIESGSHRLTTRELFNDSTFFAQSVREEWIGRGTRGLVNSIERHEQLTHIFMNDELQPFFRLPLTEEGERLSLPKESDTYSPDEGGIIELGRTSHGTPIRIGLPSLTRHFFVGGVPGSGKTNTLRLIQHGLRQNGVPFIVLEGAKREHRELMISDPEGISLAVPGRFLHKSKQRYDPLTMSVNPFEFPIGYPLSSHVNNLVDAFSSSFYLFPQLEALLEEAIWLSYEMIEHGHDKSLNWNEFSINSGRSTYPVFELFVNQLRHLVKKSSYAHEFQSTLLGAIEVRFGRMLGRTLGRLFNVCKSTYTPEQVAASKMIVEMDSLGRDASSLLTFVLTLQIKEVLEVQNENNPSDGSLRHVLIFEEAHRLLSSETGTTYSNDEGSPYAAAVRHVGRLLAEMRALGQGIIIADQIPSKIDSDIIKNMSFKVCHQLTDSNERFAMASAMNASTVQADQIAALTPGEALFSTNEVEIPFRGQCNFAVRSSMSKDQQERVIAAKSLRLMSEEFRQRIPLVKNEKGSREEIKKHLKNIQAEAKPHLEQFLRSEQDLKPNDVCVKYGVEPYLETIGQLKSALK